MTKLFSFNKPFRVLSQFTSEGDKPGLSSYISEPGIYCAGRLDYDSEGLLLLTDNGALQHRLSHPRFKTRKHYWVQVEGAPDESALEQLKRGVQLKDGPARAHDVRLINEPDIWPRHPPIRERRNIPTQWLSLTVSEGRNRQVRRMTANIGYPTLRLIRYRIGDYQLQGLQPGELRKETARSLANE